MAPSPTAATAAEYGVSEDSLHVLAHVLNTILGADKDECTVEDLARRMGDRGHPLQPGHVKLLEERRCALIRDGIVFKVLLAPADAQPCRDAAENASVAAIARLRPAQRRQRVPPVCAACAWNACACCHAPALLRYVSTLAAPPRSRAPSVLNFLFFSCGARVREHPTS